MLTFETLRASLSEANKIRFMKNSPRSPSLIT